MSNTTYGWSTRKVENGFEWAVVSSEIRAEPSASGRYIDTETLHKGTKKTRAQASGAAKKVCLSYRKAA